MTSVRSRLALALAVVLIIPAVAAAFAVGVVAPRVARQAAAAVAQQSAGTVAATLVDRCRSLGESAVAMALQAAGPDLATVATGVVQRQGSGAFAALVRGGRVVSSSGQLPQDVSAADLVRESCARPAGEAPTAPAAVKGAPVVSYVVPAVSPTGAALGSVVVGVSLDRLQLTELTEDLSLRTRTLVALACPDGRGSSTATDPGLSQVVRQIAADARIDQPTQSEGGWQVAAVTAERARTVCAVAAARQSESSAVSLAALVGLLAFGLLVSLALVLRLADSLTRPILALTEAAERVSRGDLTTRLPGTNSAELDRLSESFNHMTDELESKIGELERSRDLLRQNVGRLGDTLERTHDLDGLLMTVLGAGVSATGGQRATVWLVEGGSVVSRVSAPAGAPRSSTRRLPLGTDLAGRVAADGLPRRLTESGADSTTVLGGPALAAPLRRGHTVLGVVVVEREPEQPVFDADDEAMLVSLAGPAGIAVDNVMLHREAQRLSVTDPLTGAGNLRHMTTTLAREVERASRFARPLSVLLLDLDHFKNVNDTYGHTVGDAVLRELARRLSACVREVDVVARYGGEEFVVVTPETDVDGAERLAARICEAVREEPFVVGRDVVPVTVSVGIAALPLHGTASGDLVRSADEGLYAAKRAGRDQYRVAPHGELSTASGLSVER